VFGVDWKTVAATLLLLFLLGFFAFGKKIRGKVTG